jgi:hypothetical protein
LFLIKERIFMFLESDEIKIKRTSLTLRVSEESIDYHQYNEEHYNHVFVIPDDKPLG